MGNRNFKNAEQVMKYFREIAAIPHGSYNIDAISDYLVDFANKHGLEVVQDELKNVIIKKPASAGYENEPVLIIQGHMDMVAVCDNTAEKDMTKDGLDLAEEDGFLYAKGTSLGADDGIAIAYALAALEDDTIAHPALEVIFTVNEETGLEGAQGIDLTHISGKRLLNIDSEDEGIFTVSCAGGVRVHTAIKGKMKEITAPVVFLSLDGLLGGHSGSEIHKKRANGAHLLARILFHLDEEGYDLRLISMAAGDKDNAIPTGGSAEFAVMNLEDADEFISCAERFNDKLNEEFKGIEDDILITIGIQFPEEVMAYTEEDTENFIEYIDNEPDGVIDMCPDIDMVETSLNLGVMKLDAEGLNCQFALRSSVKNSLETLKKRVASITANYGGEASFHGEYPGWEYLSVSPFRDKMVKVYKDLYGKEPVIEGIHAGLECGFFCEKIEGLEAVSIGPDLQNVHTTKERLNLASMERVWEYLQALLAAKDA